MATAAQPASSGLAGVGDALEAIDRKLTQLTRAGKVGLVVDVALVRQPAERRDSVIAAIAERQYGVVSTAQLLAAGVGAGAIATRVAARRLHRLHRGVYAVGHMALPPLAREMAAVLACWPGALLSHGAAASTIWELIEREDDLIDVTVSRAHRNQRPGLRVHRSRMLSPTDVGLVRGIPVTSPARTLLDLAEHLPDRDLERAFDEATTRRLITPASITAAVQRAHGRRGVARLTKLVKRHAEPAFTRSEAEELLLSLIRAAGLPPPEVNGRVGRHTVDFAWRDRRQVVETDGYQFHSTRAAFEHDRARDAELLAAGFRVMRVTWRQLDEEPLAIVARLAQALAA